MDNRIMEINSPPPFVKKKVLEARQRNNLHLKFKITKIDQNKRNQKHKWIKLSIG